MANLITNIRLYKTTCIFALCMVCGFYSGIIGPSLVHMEYILHTTTQGMAMAFTGDNMGSLIGAILCAYICERYGNWEFQFGTALLLAAGFNSVAPWMPNIYWYCFMMACRSCITTYISAAAKAYVLKLWHDHRWKDAIFQGYLSTWCIGAFLAPILAIPFLCHLPEHHKRNRIKEILQGSSNNFQNNSSIIISNIANNLKSQKSHLLENPILAENQDIPDDVFTVRYLYVVVSFFSLVVSIMFYYTRNQPLSRTITRKVTVSESQLLSEYEHSSKSEKTYSEDTKSHIFRKTLEILLFTFNVFSEWQSTILGIFLSAFVIKGLGWSSAEGPLITSLFRFTQGLGRIIGIPVSVYHTPGKILVVNIVLGIFAYFFMFSGVAIYHSKSLMWLSTALAGFSVSTTYSASLLWGTQHLHTTAAYCSMFSASGSVGAMTSATLAGYLFQNYSPLAIIYMIVASAVCNIFIFCALNVMGELYSAHELKNSKRGTTYVI